MPHHLKTLEDLKDAQFIPIDLAIKYKKGFFPIWKHLLGVTPLRNSDLKRLYKYGVVEKINYTEEQVVTILKSKSPQKVDRGKCSLFDICDWCQAETYSLHKHHYPIKRSKGGQRTVSICPNCHYEFHALMEKDIFYPNKEIRRAFEECRKHKEKEIEKFVSKEVEDAE